MERETLFKIIKSHYEGDEKMFLKACRELSRDLSDVGEKSLAKAINKVIRENVTVTISNLNKNHDDFIFSIELEKTLKIIERAFSNKLIHKIFLYGNPGTGKTIFSEIVAKKLDLPIKKISLSQIIDSKLGESMKLLDQVFYDKTRTLIFIDEIDSIATKRTMGNDVFEISRVLNHFLQLLDNFSSNKIIIVATNLAEQIDPAFVRRFDIAVNFNTYEKKDIENIWIKYCEKYNLYKLNVYSENLKKLILSTYKFWTPGYIKRVALTSKIWFDEHENPKNQIFEILKLIKIGDSKTKIIEKLKELKTPIRIIKYFS